MLVSVGLQVVRHGLPLGLLTVVWGVEHLHVLDALLQVKVALNLGELVAANRPHVEGGQGHALGLGDGDGGEHALVVGLEHEGVDGHGGGAQSAEGH